MIEPCGGRRERNGKKKSYGAEHRSKYAVYLEIKIRVKINSIAIENTDFPFKTLHHNYFAIRN